MTGLVRSGRLGECEIVEPLHERDGVRVEVGRWTDDPEEPWRIGDTVIGDRGFLWVRFWFPDENYVIEKMFGTDELVGYYVDFVDGPRFCGDRLVATDLFLDIWLSPDGTFETLDVLEFLRGVVGPLGFGEIKTVVETYAGIRRKLSDGSFPPECVTDFERPG